jgi:hypothetical protein
MTTITFKPVPTFRLDDHKAVIAVIDERKAKVKVKKAKRDKINKAMANDETTDPNLAARLTDLISGRKPAVPTPWDAQLHEVKCEIRDDENDIEFLSGKAKIFEIEAERRMVDEARPQIAAHTQALWDAYVKLYEAFVPVWQAKRHLHGNSIRTFELFNDSFEEFLGVPVGVNPAWTELFRQGIAAGHIKQMPPALRPRA